MSNHNDEWKLGQFAVYEAVLTELVKRQPPGARRSIRQILTRLEEDTHAASDRYNEEVRATAHRLLIDTTLTP